MVEYEIIVVYKDGHTDEYSSKSVDIIKARFLLLKDQMNHDETMMSVTMRSGRYVMQKLVRSKINFNENDYAIG